MESVDAYLRTVVTRLFLDRGRGQRSREHTVSEVPELPAADRTRATDERDAVRSALGQLSPSQRAILVPRYGLDLPVEQVAGILRCSPGNVKSQAARGMQNGREYVITGAGWGSVNLKPAKDGVGSFLDGGRGSLPLTGEQPTRPGERLAALG